MNKVVCVECGKNRCWRKGEVPSRSGPKQRYVCFDCGRTFYVAVAKPTAQPKRTKKAVTAKSKPVVKKAAVVNSGKVSSLADAMAKPKEGGK